MEAPSAALCTVQASCIWDWVRSDPPRISKKRSATKWLLCSRSNYYFTHYLSHSQSHGRKPYFKRPMRAMLSEVHRLRLPPRGSRPPHACTVGSSSSSSPLNSSTSTASMTDSHMNATAAVLAPAALPPVLADAAAAALLAPFAPPPVLAEGPATALLALAALPPVRARHLGCPRAVDVGRLRAQHLNPLYPTLSHNHTARVKTRHIHNAQIVPSKLKL